jgi:carbohydrate diacid regulator
MIKKTFQNVINQMDAFLTSPVGVMDSEGFVLATNASENMAEYSDIFLAAVNDSMEIHGCRGYSICGISKTTKPEYIVYVRGIDDESRRTCMMLAVSLSNIRLFYDDKYDKTTFIKNIISDNTLPLDLHQRARELHMEFDQRRVAFVVKVMQSGDVAALDVVLGMFPEHEHDFVFSMDDNTIVLVKETDDTTTEEELEALAQTMIDNLNSEAMMNVLVGISTPAENLNVLAAAYKEAQVALEIGRVFENDKYILSYKSLGVGRLIYHLPTRLCQLFLQEVLTKKGLDALDDEIITTIYEFFKNDLNVSETARKLYIHRNTLVYRLDKVLKTIGLDLRKFDDAVVFKVAMMVNQYLVSNPMKI